LQESYDVIVIVGGAAGVETGNNDNDNITNPVLWLNVLHNDTLKWHLQTVAQTALNGRVIDFGLAKGYGRKYNA
jgi:hypothetical protein